MASSISFTNCINDVNYEIDCMIGRKNIVFCINMFESGIIQAMTGMSLEKEVIIFSVGARNLNRSNETSNWSYP